MEEIKLREDGNYSIIDNIRYHIDNCHGAAVKAGWYSNPRTGKPLKKDFSTAIALIHSELSEALEGDRKGLMDDHLKDRIMSEVEIADAIIRACDTAGHEGFELEEYLADITPPDVTGLFPRDIAQAHQFFSFSLYNIQNNCRDAGLINYISGINQLVAMGDEYGFDLEKVIKMKMEYNAQRADHKAENRAKKGGKEY